MSKTPDKPTSIFIGSTLNGNNQGKSTYGITTSSKKRGGNSGGNNDNSGGTNINIGLYCCCCSRGGGSASLTMAEYIEEEIVL
ncbi:hypothetical protein [Streptococcus parasanguinis]|uniref:hypothetical protein n=1 Tax=Streptococcus parasanguinis TaxID=1318 RepID=UPI0012BD5501|nr:hypothetical protein [Streptococcus parasanguinis]MTS07494.1 hypothetical protein [Streptococcus parasanguinis]